MRFFFPPLSLSTEAILSIINYNNQQCLPASIKFVFSFNNYSMFYKKKKPMEITKLGNKIKEFETEIGLYMMSVSTKTNLSLIRNLLNSTSS